MYFVFSLLSVFLVQTQPPPAKQPPANNPWVPPNGKQVVPEKKQPPNNPAPQPGQSTVRPTEPAPPPGDGGPYGPMYQVPVDGTYQVLAYDKFGQTLPGMNTIKVVIRQSILYFPGDAKTPGKVMRLTFGPQNRIMITPLDGQDTPVPPVNSQPPVANNEKQRAQEPLAGTFVPDQTRRNSGGQNINQTGFVPPSPNSEWGVYVISGEFFSIAILGNLPVLNNAPQTRNMPDGNPQPGGAPNNQTASPGQGNEKNNIIPNPPPRRPTPNPTPTPEVTRASIVLRRVAN